jgi:radical SAM superfamily enzyme YgiQ (UPF0313 family)
LLTTRLRFFSQLVRLNKNLEKEVKRLTPMILSPMPGFLFQGEPKRRGRERDRGYKQLVITIISFYETTLGS